MVDELLVRRVIFSLALNSRVAFQEVEDMEVVGRGQETRPSVRFSLTAELNPHTQRSFRPTQGLSPSPHHHGQENQGP